MIEIEMGTIWEERVLGFALAGVSAREGGLRGSDGSVVVVGFQVGVAQHSEGPGEVREGERGVEFQGVKTSVAVGLHLQWCRCGHGAAIAHHGYHSSIAIVTAIANAKPPHNPALRHSSTASPSLL